MHSYLQQPHDEGELGNLIDELDKGLRELEKQELIRLYMQLKRLGKTLEKQQADVLKEEDLRQIKFINSDVQQQEITLKEIQERIHKYLAPYIRELHWT